VKTRAYSAYCRCAIGWALAVGLIGCESVRPWTNAYNGYPLDPPVSKPAVVWQRPDGSPFDISKETAGKVTLVSFGYTHCADVCPAELMNIGRALRSIGGDSAARIRVLFVTLDPKRDTAAVLQKWLGAFDPRIIGLRGAPASVDREVSRLGLAPREPGDTATDAGPAHAAVVVAFSRDGLGHFRYPANTNAEAWAYDLRKLLRDSVP
jgi:protein SCO1/2